MIDPPKMDGESFAHLTKLVGPNNGTPLQHVATSASNQWLQCAPESSGKGSGEMFLGVCTKACRGVAQRAEREGWAITERVATALQQALPNTSSTGSHEANIAKPLSRVKTILLIGLCVVLIVCL